MSQNVLVIGSGGREHALSWKLAQSPEVKQVFVAPGNVGIVGDKIKLASVDVSNHEVLVKWCVSNSISMVVVGPENVLATGVADALQASKIHCFGPSKNATQIESDKSWAKVFMDKYNIPTARWGSFTQAEHAKKFIKNSDFPALVVKASGLAAGKGVVVAASADEACAAVDEMLTDQKFGSAGNVVVVEELLEGEEVSVLGFCDGKTVKAMLPAQDHKRLLDGDQGPNTGGMGAYCPCPLLNEKELKEVEESILKKTIDGLNKEGKAGIPFVGVLYAGLMVTKDGPKVLEYNARFGDPETQVILPLLDSDLYKIMMACCKGELLNQSINWKKNTYAVGVVMASRGYPETSTKGCVISGIEDIARIPDHIVFHSGTAPSANGDIVTNGGRVLMPVALAPSLPLAVAQATSACDIIKFDGAQYRRDIAHKGISRSILAYGQMTYKASGVDITAGDNLVSRIKPMVAKTKRSGMVGSIGGFGGLFDVAAAGYKDPLLVSGSDGVGTKLKVAQACGLHSSIGIDLVAMCVNDILAHGAEPLFFLDYFACSSLDVEVAAEVISGISEGCHAAGCALIGGETAEMPGLYEPGDYDLAGFAVGAVEKTNLMPRTKDICAGDVIIALPSSGVHSNGYSLVRKIVENSGLRYSDPCPFSSSGKSLGEELLTPTKIYVKNVLPALKSGRVKALAHITGGGLTENIPRVLPPGTSVNIDAKTWNILPVFAWLAAAGGVNEYEMLRTFNCGVGLILVVSPSDVKEVMGLIAGEKASVIGHVENLPAGDDHRVKVRNFATAMDSVMRPLLPPVIRRLSKPKKRVGVLISGSGTNLQALIDKTQDPASNMGCEIVVVISNKKDVEGLKRAERAGIPTKVVSHTDFKSREEFDMACHSILETERVDIVCLAGFMRILSGPFVRLWRGRMLNIHPALLPLFKGTHAQKQALEAGVRISGCTVHFVEEDVDAGAILVQKIVPIKHGDTEETLQERIKTVERDAFPEGLKMVANGVVYLDLSTNRLVWRD
ncbi:trifunctional purine biosynthetic protein adenosine-3 isoform X2 [Thrips palmi]|nr:trifunctional purine biosynthetic protein adenosine-3 isoform X2 [Thrips palmi]XP_034242451.1 trifunctional purine biosynthetic protein adenosine-3 isoform X2 [Thrips palmi]XP_034242452.1 trifunctional purine biosynthetic protein adenosine-3 isoform X2 [Thrips palmi]